MINLGYGVRSFHAVDYARRGTSTPGWWEVAGKTCIAAWAAKGAASQAASYTDLSGNGNTLTTSSAPSWNSTDGWDFTTHSQWLDTGIAPQDDNYSILVRWSNLGGEGNYYLFGRYADGNLTYFAVKPSDWGWSTYFYAGATGYHATAAVTGGVTGFAAKDAYHNGSNVGTMAAGSNTDFTLSVYIGNLHYGGATLGIIGEIQAVAIYSDTLASGDITTLTSAMNAL